MIRRVFFMMRRLEVNLMRILPVVAACGMTWAQVGCRYEGTGTKMQWAPDMADSPTSKPHKSFIDPPEGSVAMGAHFYAATPEAAETEHVMPDEFVVDADGKFLKRGDVLYNTFCIACHGADAKGQGSLGPNFPMPPDLTHESYKARKDGFFYYRITFGANIMPAYGYAISEPERWLIVKYLRTLQQK